MMTKSEIVRRVKAVLTPDLLAPGFSDHCYTASEAAYHALGGKEAGYKPMNLVHEGVSHWWLLGPDGVIDPTAAQFRTPVPYAQGRGRGFLTKQPSKRAQEILRRAGIAICD